MTPRSCPDLHVLSSHDVEALDHCLRGVLNDRAAFSDEEFSTIMGADREHYRVFVEHWPIVLGLRPGECRWRGSTSDGWSLLENALNNIIGYPHASNCVPRVSDVERLWATIFGVPYGAPIPDEGS